MTASAQPQPEVPKPAVIEIIERGVTPGDSPRSQIVVPNEVRVNGQPLLVARDGVKIHEINIGTAGAGDLALVTLTLIVRRVVIAAEGDLAEVRNPA